MRQEASVTLPLEVTLEELYNGATLRVANKKQGLCPKCRGTGTAKPQDLKVCSGCKGTGTKVKVQQLGPGFVQQFQTTCDECGGKGKTATSTCPHCKGKKVETVEETLTIIIEKGMNDGDKISFERGCDEHPDTIPGDLHFQIRTASSHFQRKGNDLHLKTTISLLEALNGFRHEFEHLDGHKIILERKEVTPPGYVLTLKDEGMPMHNFPSQSGTLHVEFSVRFPTQLTQAQKDGFAAILKQ